MLKKTLFDELTRLGACAAAVSFLRLQDDPVVALAELPPGYRDWLAQTLSLPALKAYEEACTLAWKAYVKTSLPAWKAYEEACTLAWKAYVKTSAPAWKAYEEAIASAWKAYVKTSAPAWKAYEEAIASARKTYVNAVASEIMSWYEGLS